MRTSMIVVTVLLSFTASCLTAGENAPPRMAPDAAWTVDKSNTLAYPDWLQLGREFRPELRSILSSEAGNLQYRIRVPKGARGTIAVAVGEAFWSEPGALGTRTEGDRVGFDLIVNEAPPERIRRTGQLIWSCGEGWVYLQGDRRPPQPFGALVLG